MLTLTETASQVVGTIAERQEESADAGLRISPSSDGAFALTTVSSGEPGDDVVTSGDATVYLDEVASAALDDKVLDADVGPDGAVSFRLANRTT